MEHTSDREQILAIVAQRAEAANARDAVVLADLDPDVTTFDITVPLYNRGNAVAAERTRQWLASFGEGPVWEDRDVKVVVDRDVAFCHMLSYVRGVQATGQSIDMWFRTTLGLNRQAGEWRIVHLHTSVPFDPESGQARLDLTP